MFVDAQEMAKNHPLTFEAPSSKELSTVQHGSFVKVCADRERFWVKVDTVKGDIISGVINNDLICTDEHGLRCDDVINFEKRNVYQILED